MLDKVVKNSTLVKVIVVALKIYLSKSFRKAEIKLLK